MLRRCWVKPMCKFASVESETFLVGFLHEPTGPSGCATGFSKECFSCTSTLSLTHPSVFVALLLLFLSLLYCASYRILLSIPTHQFTWLLLTFERSSNTHPTSEPNNSQSSPPPPPSQSPCSVFASLNPSWSKSIFLDGYKFGVPYYIEVGVFDFDVSQTGKTARQLAQMDAHSQQAITGDASNRSLLRNGKFPHKIMGTALFEVGDVVGGRGNVRSKSLQTGGAVYVHIERCSSDGDKGSMCIQLKGKKLHNVQSIGKKSSPFYELYRRVERPTGATW